MQMAWKRFIGCNAFFILVEVFVQWQEEKKQPFWAISHAGSRGFYQGHGVACSCTAT